MHLDVLLHSDVLLTVQLHKMLSFSDAGAESHASAAGRDLIEPSEQNPAMNLEHEDGAALGDDRFQTLVEQAAIGIEQVSLDGRVLHVNRVFAMIAGI